MTLAEFESRLDPQRFVRVHRSRIVNLDHVDRAEPAGAGRLLLHMDNGEVVSTSRGGAQELKNRAI
jgi:DNA-binding LytR/AlgR family response regulator